MSYRIGDRVTVYFNPHEGDTIRLPGEVTQILQSGPADGPVRMIQVAFDDPKVYGGNGIGWFTPEHLQEKA